MALATLTVSSGGTVPGSMLLSADYNLGICLSLVHLLQTFIPSTDFDRKCSVQTEQDEDSKLNRLL